MRSALRWSLAALAVVCATTSVQAQNIYTWTLSNSNIDPFSNTGLAPAAGPTFLYLWLACASGDGATAAEFAVSAPVGSAVLGFTPSGGFNIASIVPEMLLAFPCDPGGSIAGAFLVLDITPGDYCFVPSVNGVNATVDCTTSSAWDNFWIGYNNSGQSPCQFTLECPPLAVEDTSWGSMKALYR